MRAPEELAPEIEAVPGSSSAARAFRVLSSRSRSAAGA